MISGILLLMLTGLCWAFAGGLLSYSARNRVALATLLGPQQVLALLVAFLAVPDYPRLAQGVSPGMWAMIYLGNGAVFLGLWWHQGGRPARGTLLLAVIGAAVGIVATLTLFSGLDLLAGQRMASLGFPIAVGACIVIFALYSALWLREPFTRRHLAGLILGLAGMILLAGGA